MSEEQTPPLKVALTGGLGVIPRKRKGIDYRDSPADMEPEFLVSLAFQVYARAMHPACDEALHNRAMELKGEVLRRLLTPNVKVKGGA